MFGKASQIPEVIARYSTQIVNGLYLVAGLLAMILLALVTK